MISVNFVCIIDIRLASYIRSNVVAWAPHYNRGKVSTMLFA